MISSTLRFIASTFVVFSCFFVNSTFAQLQLDGIDLYIDSVNKLLVWTEISSNSEYKLRVGDFDGNLTFEKSITCGICPSINTNSIKTKNNLLLLTYWSDNKDCKDKNTKYNGGFLMIDLNTKKVIQERNSTPSYHVILKPFWFPELQKMVIEVDNWDNDKKGVWLIDGLGKDQVLAWEQEFYLDGIFDKNILLMERTWDVKKEKYIKKYVAVDVQLSKFAPIEFKNDDEHYIGAYKSVNGQPMVQVNYSGKDKTIWFRIDFEKGKFEKIDYLEAKDVPKFQYVKPEYHSRYSSTMAKNQNVLFITKNKTVEEKMTVLNELYTTNFGKNAFWNKTIFKLLQEILVEQPENEKAIKIADEIVNSSENLSGVFGFIQPLIDKNILPKSTLNNAVISIKKSIQKNKKVPTSDYTNASKLLELNVKINEKQLAEKLKAEYDLQCWQFFNSDPNKFQMFQQAEYLAGIGNQSAYSSFLQIANDIPNLLRGSVHNAFAEAVRESATETKNWQIGDSILRLYQSSFNSGLNSDGNYVGVVKTYLYFKNDFQKADSVMAIFKKLYSGYEKADKWIENYPFNAGIHAFNTNDMKLANRYLLDYVQKGKEFEKDAYLRIFESGYQLKDLKSTELAFNWIDKQLTPSMKLAYFTNFDLLKGALTTFSVPLKSNLKYFEDLSREFNSLKLLKNFNTNSVTKERMEKIAFIFDSIGNSKIAAEMYNIVANYYFDAKQYQLSGNNFKRCADLSINNFSCHKDYAISLLNQGNLVEASSYIETYLDKHSEDVNLRKAMGLILNEKGNKALKNNEIANSVELFSQSLTYDSNAVTCLLLAYAYQRDGKISKKDELVRKAKILNPKVLEEFPDFKVLLKL